MYSGSLSGTHKIRYRKILRGHHDVSVCFIQDMWGTAMHMHCAADLVTDEPIWLKKAPGYFSLVAAGHDREAACGMLCRQKVDLCTGFSCITAIKSVA
ncbi:hypothetical protein DWV19_00875 [Clostridiaceae bacterium AF02-42]|nr:hypothetical protein DWY93_00770 [Clostridium sp. AF28-12]RGE05037.1 hypothetical protein DWV19_00875 [Clostridiaceae bacterium AF02-42]